MPVSRRRRRPLSDRLSEYLRTRTAIGRSLDAAVGELRTRRGTLHWSNLFGVVSLACAAVILVTGVILMFFYTPSSETVTYNGGYLPLQGAEVSKAFDSTMRLSLEVRGGLVLRQAHHWAALVMPASILLQLIITFFTGGFRRPRQASWVMLFLLAIVVLAGGWSGYALPDDMLSGTGLRIVQGIVLGIPVVGTWLATLLFGGEFPGTIIENLYPIHVMIVPLLMILLIAGRIHSAYVNKPAQFPGPGRTEQEIVGLPLFPNAATRAAGLFAIVSGVLFVMAATVTVSPIWTFGPSSPGDVSAGSQPDWYTGFLDGALRLVPPGWEVVWLGRTWTLAVIVPLAVIGLFLALVMLYPYLEGWVTRDRREHHLLERPRNAPRRTALGVGGLVFYGVLWIAASADLMATQFRVSIEGIIGVLQVTLIVGPLIAFEITRRVCIGLQKKDREILLHGYETGRIVRMPGGEYIEVHGEIDRYERWRLIDRDRTIATPARPDEAGRLPLRERLRASLARWFFEDRISPIGRPELDSRSEPRDSEVVRGTSRRS